MSGRWHHEVASGRSYLRVSTGEQTTANQREALEAVAAQRGWEIVATYKDDGISGSKVVTSDRASMPL